MRQRHRGVDVMRDRLGLLLLCLMSLSGQSALAKVLTSFDYKIEESLVEVAPGRELFTRVFRGDPNLPAVVLLNGLTQDTDHWKSTVPEILKTGATVMVYDAFHQGRTLAHFVDKHRVWNQLAYRPLLPPLLFERQVRGHMDPLLPAAPIVQQAEDLKVLVAKTLGNSKVVVVGLSYGGGLNLEYAAIDSERIEAVISLAPYVEPLTEQDQIVRILIGNYLRMNPFSDANEAELYDFFLRGLVLGTYHHSEPTIMKWGSFQPYANSELARGIRHSDVSKLVKRLRPGTFHLGIAGLDSYIQRKVLEDFWESVPSKARASVTVFEGVEHKINESVGPFLGSWIAKIVTRKKYFSGGSLWSANPQSGLVKEVFGGRSLILPPSSICENVLLKPVGEGSINLPVDRIARHPAEILMHSLMQNTPANLREMSRRVARFWGML